MNPDCHAVGTRNQTRVLLTCVGRRNYLIDYFRTAVGPSGQVLGADASVHAPALQAADEAFVVPPLADPDAYLEALREICWSRAVQLLVPLNDYELAILSQARDSFTELGTTVLVSDPAVVRTCLDKWAAADFLRRHGIPTPATQATLVGAQEALARGAMRFPLVVKPRWGSGSAGVLVVADPQDLPAAIRIVRRNSEVPQDMDSDGVGDVIVQQLAAGLEYGLDIVNDLSGHHVGTLVKLKLAMRAGETASAQMVHHPQLLELGARIAESLGHIGPLDCDVVVADGVPQVLDLNPRFGGGYPFSHMAGADVPGLLVSVLRGQPADPRHTRVEVGQLMSKYYQLAVSSAHTAPPAPACPVPLPSFS